MTTKLEFLAGNEWLPVHYPGTFAVELTTGPERLRIAPRDGHASVLLALAEAVGPEYKVLYVLHTPHGDASAGRYESPAIDTSALRGFIRHFSGFIAGDSRHDLWVHTRIANATFVWDRHDLLYAYGPLSAFEAILTRLGLRRGTPVPMPDPHAHRYHSEWDTSERELVSWFDWEVTPLREEDEQ